MKRSFNFFVIPLLFILSAMAMRRWGLLFSAAVPNFVLVVGVVYTVRMAPFVPYFIGAFFAFFVLAYPAVFGGEAIAAFAVLFLLYWFGRRLPWRNAVGIPMLFVGGTVLWYAVLGDAGFFIRDPMRAFLEIVFGLAASGAYWFVLKTIDKT